MKQTVCDRCHGQKLKCELDDDAQDTCKRCRRAGATCTYPSDGERWIDQIEDRSRPTAAHSFDLEGRILGRNELPSMNSRFISPRQRPFIPSVPSPLEHIPAIVSRKRLRSNLEGPSSPFTYSTSAEGDQALGAVMSQDTLGLVAAAPHDDAMNAQFDFTSSDMGALYFDHLPSSSLLGTHSNSSPHWIPTSNGRDEGIVSPSLSSTAARRTATACQEPPRWDSSDMIPSHFGDDSNAVDRNVEERLCRLWRSLGCRAGDTSQALVAEAFEHTTTLIGIVRTFASPSNRTTLNTDTHGESMEAVSPQSRLSDGFSGSEQTKCDDRDPVPSIDPSVVLLVPACYIRLTRLYQRLIDLVLEELENAGTPDSTPTHHRSSRSRTLSGGTTAMGWVQTVSSVTHLSEKLSSAMLPLGCSPRSGTEADKGGNEFDSLIAGPIRQLSQLRTSLQGSVREATERIRSSDML